MKRAKQTVVLWREGRRARRRFEKKESESTRRMKIESGRSIEKFVTWRGISFVGSPVKISFGENRNFKWHLLEELAENVNEFIHKTLRQSQNTYYMTFLLTSYFIHSSENVNI